MILLIRMLTDFKNPKRFLFWSKFVSKSHAHFVTSSGGFSICFRLLLYLQFYELNGCHLIETAAPPSSHAERLAPVLLYLFWRRRSVFSLQAGRSCSPWRETHRGGSGRRAAGGWLRRSASGRNRLLTWQESREALNMLPFVFQEQLNRYERAIYASLSGNLRPVREPVGGVWSLWFWVFKSLFFVSFWLCASRGRTAFGRTSEWRWTRWWRRTCCRRAWPTRRWRRSRGNIWRPSMNPPGLERVSGYSRSDPLKTSTNISGVRDAEL